MAFDACLTHYNACHDAFDALMAMVAGELLARVVEAMGKLLLDWSEYKRSAALLDFDDLLYTAKDLLAKNEDVRQALAKRFQHVLVDEFQDTDPVQIDILWRLCGERQRTEIRTRLRAFFEPARCFWSATPSRRSTVFAALT